VLSCGAALEVIGRKGEEFANCSQADLVSGMLSCLWCAGENDAKVEVKRMRPRDELPWQKVKVEHKPVRSEVSRETRTTVQSEETMRDHASSRFNIWAKIRQATIRRRRQNSGIPRVQISASVSQKKKPAKSFYERAPSEAKTPVPFPEKKFDPARDSLGFDDI